MEHSLIAPEIAFEFKKDIEAQFLKLAQDYATLNKTNITPVVRFSPDLRIVAVDLETVSPTPFFMNIGILRVLEGAITYFKNNETLTSSGFKLIEQALVDTAKLNTIGRLHRENHNIAYHTGQAFIFRTSEENLKAMLQLINQQIDEKKSAPDYIEKLSIKSLNYTTHTPIVFDSALGVGLTLTKVPTTLKNTLVMGITIELRNTHNGRCATLHIPNKFMPEFTPQPAARILNNSDQKCSFVYYDWLVGEDKLIDYLQTASSNYQPEHIIDFIKSYIRYDVEVLDIDFHVFEFNVPTANFAPISEIAFITVLHNNGLFENTLVKVQSNGDIKVLNSKGLAIYPPDHAMPYLSELKENAASLFKSNRLFIFDQIKQFRKNMSGFNLGLAKAETHIYLP